MKPLSIPLQSLMGAIALALAVSLMGFDALADTPASSVRTAPVNPGEQYPGVDAHSEGWFDVGGFCKVVDVGDLSALGVNAKGVPVFIPGPAAQWANYRTLAATHYNGQLLVTTCCRPQANVATLCTEAGATLVSVSRQYGKLGEVDTVTASCIDMWGKPYTDQVNVGCEVSGGGPDGPDAQGVWVETTADATSNCTPNANITYGGCSASCGGGNLYETVQNSCGVVTAQGYIGPSCNTQSCCSPSYSKSCSGSTATYTDVSCGTGSYQVSGGCTYGVVGGGHCSCVSYGKQPNGDPYYDCGGNPGHPSQTWVLYGQQTNCTVSGPDCISVDGDFGGTTETCYGYQ